MTRTQQYPIYQELKREAVNALHQDPAMVEAALDILDTSANVQNANADENGQRINPSLAVLIVRGEHGWVVVRPGSCTCGSKTICAHRIAAWIHRESVIRPLAQAANKNRASILKMLEVVV